MTKRKFNIQFRHRLIANGIINNCATPSIVNCIIAVIRGLDYNTYEISSKGNGYIGKVTIREQIYHVNKVFYDEGTKAVVFQILEDNGTLNPHEFFVDEENYDNFSEKEVKSFLGMLSTYFNSGKVYGIDKENFTETNTLVRTNNVSYDTFVGNLNLIEFYKNHINKLQTFKKDISNIINLN